MTEGWFWSTPEWQAYLKAYGKPHDPHYGPKGNLVVPLGPESEMFANIRKGHRAAIKRAARTLWIFDDFGLYQNLHRLANGDVRPVWTFDVMRSWIPEHAFVLVAMQGPLAASAAYFIVHAEGSYYASGPRSPLIDAPGAAHLLIWSAMHELGNRGYRWMDFGPVPDDDASEKEKSIYHFKHGFGGVVKEWPYV